MDSNLTKDLAQYRFNKAEENLKSAKKLFDEKLYSDSVSRSYYAIFSSIRAVLAMDKIDFRKHAGVISYFQKEYIKTKIFNRKYSDYIRYAFDSRSEAEYRDFIKVTRNDARLQIKNAEELLNAIKDYLVEIREVKI